MTEHQRQIVTRAAEGLDRRRFTVAEVEEMVAFGLMADERNELIGGELVPMQPEGPRDERVRLAIYRHWCRSAPDDVEVASKAAFRLSAYTCFAPDLVLFSRAMDLTKLSAENVYLVVEIADTSLGYDMGRKAALYASFGVRELWVIDAVHLTTRVFRGPAPDGYREVRDTAGHDMATPLLAPSAFALRLSELIDTE